jgi:NhaP-type Na+/H+ and K+/H+ antiporter
MEYLSNAQPRSSQHLIPVGGKDMKLNIRKQMTPVLCLFALGILLASNSFAAPAYYTVKIAQIVPRSSSGDVFVQFDPGATETRFTQRSRGVLLGSDTGSNKVMAVLLTAVTLGAEVTILLNDVPSFANIQVIQSTGLVSP